MEWLTDWFGAGNYDVARQILQRGVAALYVVAFVAAWRQGPALIGERGLLPTPEWIARTSAQTSPSLFRWRYSDRLLVAVSGVGIALGMLVVAGLPQAGPWWVPTVVFLAMWALYLSIVNIGQTFYSFGWETLLLETGFLVAFLGSAEVATPILVIVLTRWLLFRVEFGAGLIKMRGDRVWRDLTALNYHHETQPMPGPFSWHAHRLPTWWHRVEVVGNHITQLIVPFGLFAPQPVASIAAVIMVATQGWLMLTGNFAWLNALTVVLAFAAISDDVWSAVLPGVELSAADGAPVPVPFAVVVSVVTALVVVRSYQPVRNLLSSRQMMNTSFDRWRLVNTYGAFGSITKRRNEIVIEATTEPVPSSAEWREYMFHGKPSEPSHRPRQFAPYHLRLDWQMWFLALGSPDDRWFRALINKLLDADPATLRLLRADPFDGERPTYVRARSFSYRYTTRAERKKTGQWWVREFQYDLVPPISRR